MVCFVKSSLIPAKYSRIAVSSFLQECAIHEVSIYPLCHDHVLGVEKTKTKHHRQNISPDQTRIWHTYEM